MLTTPSASVVVALRDARRSRALITGGGVFGSAELPLPAPGSLFFLVFLDDGVRRVLPLALDDEVLLVLCSDFAA